jgi:hypothetical protein
MTSKNDDVAGKMPTEMPELPSMPEMPSIEDSIEEVMKSVGTMMGGSMRGIQELAAWQVFAGSAVAGMAGDTRHPTDGVAERAAQIADHLLAHWKERRAVIEQSESTKK